jgi:hypothetical protein
MNTYKAIFNQRSADIEAPSLYAAKQSAIELPQASGEADDSRLCQLFKPRKAQLPQASGEADDSRLRQQHMIIVMLAEKDGEPVIHTPDF